MSSKKKYDANADIRKYGPQNYLQLQQANASRTGGLDALKGIEAKMNTTPLSITDNPYGPRQSGALRVSPEGILQDYWGNSMFDTEMTTEGQLQDVQYQRAENEPWVLKALNGVTKAVGTAATTWLDGVAGLALGLTEGIYGAIADPNRNFFQAFNHGLYNNEISKGLREFSQWMEEALPNYKTKDEELNPYTLKNLTSVNTIFNDFLKVIGFSVGAYYSGGAWNKVLGLLTKAGTLSSTAAKTIGSVVSGVNEARIEAGNLYDENVREQTGELMNAYQRASDELQQQIDALNEQPDTREKAIQLAQLQQQQTELDSKYELEVNNIKDRAEKAAQADMYMNAAYLPFQDAWAYGRLYRRASRMKHTLGKAVEETTDAAEDAARKTSKETAKKAGKKKLIDQAAEQEAVEKGLSEAVEDGAEGYKAKIVSRKKAALKGLAKASGEYAEEVNQGFFSSFSSNLYTPDSPDAYYQALTNEDYKIKTNDFRTAMTHGIMDSWGNPASHVEGLMGFVNGLLGMPTFGRVQNSDENTYLGKGKPVGLSGGILGEMKYYARRNKEAQEAADIMNKTTKKLKDKSDDASNFITRMQAFSNAMDGFNDDDDKFEFKNASDNEMFNAIDAFARTGRLDHFKQLVKDGFGDPEQFTDEQLEDISRTAGKNEWLTTDGKPMVESEEGRQQMRKELKKQQQDTLNAIDRYEKSLERVRQISNNSLTNDQTAELAWLHWKQSQFEDRFKDIKSDNEELFNKMAEEMQRVSDEYQGALDDTVSDDQLQEEKKRLEEELKRTDLTPEERKDLKDDLEATNAGIAARNEASSLKSILQFIKALKDAKTPLDLAAIIASNPSIMDYLNTTFNTTLDSEGVKMEKTKSWRDFYNQFEDKLGISFDDFSNVMDNLRDSAKLAIAARDFNKRFMEFSEDPIKLIENREKIDKKAAKENKAKTKAKGVDRLNNMEISEIAMDLRDGSIDLEEATKAMEGMDFESVEGGPLNAKEKLEEAQKINDKYSDAIEKIEQQHQDGIIDDPTYNSAIQALEQSLAIAESVEELLDINGEAFLDNDNIDTSDLENLPLDQLEEEIEKRRAQVQTVINGINQDQIDAVEATQDMPNTQDIEDSVDLQDETVLNDTTGHDSIDKPKAENIREEQRKNQEPQGPVTEWTARQIATGAVQAVNTSPENEEGLINIVTDLGNIMDSLIKGGIENKKIAETIKDLQGYSMLKAIAGEELANAILNNYLVARRQNLDAISTAKQDTIEQEKSNNKEDDTDPPTPDVTIDDIESQIDDESQRDYSEGEIETSAPTLNYWKPTVTELPIHRDRGDNRPYWEIAKDLKKPNSSPRYTAAQLQRMKAVGEYMQEKQAFSRVNAGQVLSKNDGQNATEVHFITDRALNEKAGEVVILMVDFKGNIIGDLMSKNDPAAQKQIGLIPFIEKCEQILANDKTSNNYVTFKGSTTVLQNLIGKVMYTKKGETHTLNEIHGDQEFKLGIAVTEGSMPIIRTSGRAKKLGTTEEEDSIVTPLKSKNGQAFLIMPTSGAAKRGVARKYITVPFHMPKYSEQTKDSALGRAIEDILKRISQGSNDEDAVKLKNELAELISVARSKNGYPEIHINYTGDTVKVTIKPVGADHQITLYNGNKNNENMVSNIQSKLYGTPFQINRKYINRDYKGQSYNRMIGELARTNIAVGETHTRSDWFTINPIGADGKQVTGNKIPSKKQNPGAQKPASASGAPAGSIEVPYNGGSAYVDTNTWDVWYNGKNYGKATGPNVNKVRARAYGIKENLDMSKPYDTTWGYYNPVTNSFETKPKPEPQPKEDKIVDWVVSGETKFKINTNTWQVLNADGTEYNGPDINIYRAKVYGQIHELDMSKPYETPWGIFNPKDNTFDNSTSVIQKDTENNTEEEGKKDTDKKEETPQKATKNTPEELREKAKANGLINTAVKKAVWEALTTEQQQKLIDNIKMKQRQLMQGLVSAFNKSDNTFDKKALGGSVDQFLNKKALFSKVGQRNYGKKWDQAKELTKMEKMLPQFTKGELIKIQKGLIRIADSSDPGLAYGMFQSGVITISEVAASGTLYHEAFHAVYHTLMSDAERQKIMDSAAQLYGMDKTQLELEETLAEDFRKYVQFREAQEAEMKEKYANKSILGRIMRFFKSLFNLCKKIRGKEPYMNKVFKDIYNGRYAERKVQQYDAETRFKYEDFTPEMISIIKKAPRNSEGKLLAPNGKVSKLTERQYAHVRTKAFKEWFGDWINDPENASKVIDNKGEDATFEPLVVYHYTDNENLNEFDPNFENYFVKEGGGTKNAFFFTEDKVEPGSEDNFLTSRKRRIDVFLNIKNLKEYHGTKEDLHKKGTTYRQIVNNSAKNNPKTGGLHFSGFDDNRKENQDIWIIHNPNQVKSATDNVGTYSKDNNDIRYSRVNITELQQEIDDANRQIQEIRRQMEIAKNRVSKGNWVREKGGNRYGILSNIGYFYESDAEDNIPDDIREAAEVKYHRGRYTIQYNPQLCISKIKFLTQQMYDLQAQIELLKEYNDSFPEDRALSDMALREQQQREDMLDQIAEIRQYHSDKLMFSNLSKEDQDYILRRGISLEEYNMMSDQEKRVLLECKS